MTDYRSRSMWLDGVPGELAPRASLPGPVDADVAIAGAGFTGLWTAYYLKKADPSLRIVVLEKEIAGFGASGRNGGWCHTTFPGSRERAAREHGRQAVIDQQRALFGVVPEVARVVAEEGIDARFIVGGQLDLATTPVQLLRLREGVEYERSWGFGEDDYALLGAAEMRARIRVAGCLGAGYTPHGACVDPARLARGLADAVRARGRAHLRAHARHRASSRTCSRPPSATSRAEVVVRATEAFTPRAPRVRALRGADLLADDRHRAAARSRSGTRSAGGGTRPSATAASSSSTRCTPPTAASPSAAAAPPTITTRA